MRMYILIALLLVEVAAIEIEATPEETACVKQEIKSREANGTMPTNPFEKMGVALTIVAKCKSK